jgi:hypothetical protein
MRREFEQEPMENMAEIRFFRAVDYLMETVESFQCILQRIRTGSQKFCFFRPVDYLMETVESFSVFFGAQRIPTGSNGKRGKTSVSFC